MGCGPTATTSLSCNWRLQHERHPTPSFNFRDPAACWRPMAPDGQCQREQARWRQLFTTLTEITHDLPTHFSANTQAATAIDRIF
eukprot:6625899-Pyramimonas_sp.AAC.1